MSPESYGAHYFIYLASSGLSSCSEPGYWDGWTQESQQDSQEMVSDVEAPLTPIRCSFSYTMMENFVLQGLRQMRMVFPFIFLFPTLYFKCVVGWMRPHQLAREPKSLHIPLLLWENACRLSNWSGPTLENMNKDCLVLIEASSGYPTSKILTISWSKQHPL